MPAPTPEALERLKTLVGALTAQTRAGHLGWKDRSPSNLLSRAINRESFSVSLPKSTITIHSLPGMTVTDSQGEILQDYFPAAAGLMMEKDPDLDRALNGLLEEIHEQQRRALSVLDDVIADVEGLGNG
jgi:hypothetical protein